MNSYKVATIVWRKISDAHMPDAGERVLVSLGGSAPSYEAYLKYLHGKLCWYRNGLPLFFKPEYWANLPTVTF